jgi:GNAT superfamily N-acetyltransferase
MPDQRSPHRRRRPEPWASGTHPTITHPTITHPTSPHYPEPCALRHNGRDPTRPLTTLGLLMKRTFRYLDGALAYRAPAGVHERPRRAGVAIEVAREPDRAAVLDFEAATFPHWLRWFQRLDASIVVARDTEGRVVGALLFCGPGRATIYAPLLGPMAGTIGCVGVADHAQGRGVGSAMVARASELLRDAGTHACHIGWTVRRDFYTRLGYVPWRRYLMSRRPLVRS